MAQTVRRLLPFAGLFLGVWSMLPPFTGPPLNTETRVEVADHVMPGIVMLVASVAALVLTRRRSRPALMLGTGLLVLLAGLWMTATHVPLVAQAARDDAPTGATIYHSVPGLVVLALGLCWAAAWWWEVER